MDLVSDILLYILDDQLTHCPSVSGYNHLQSPQFCRYSLENNVARDASIRSQEDSIIMRRGSDPIKPSPSQFYPPLSQYYPPAPQHYPTSNYRVPPTQYIPYSQVLFHS